MPLSQHHSPAQATSARPGCFRVERGGLALLTSGHLEEVSLQNCQEEPRNRQRLSYPQYWRIPTPCMTAELRGVLSSENSRQGACRHYSPRRGLQTARGVGGTKAGGNASSFREDASLLVASKALSQST